MPAVTTVAFASLLQRGSSHSSSAPTTHQLDLHHCGGGAGDGNPAGGPPRRSSSSTFSYYISSPALYATPEPAQFAGSSSAMCVSPSPYVVNHKRREWPAAAPIVAQPAGEEHSSGDVKSAGCPLATVTRGEPDATAPDAYACNGVQLADKGGGGSQFEEGDIDEDKEQVEDFFDPKRHGHCDSSEAEEETITFTLPRLPEPNTPLLNQSEFYDAPEDFFSDASSAQQPRLLELDSELRSVRLNLFEEIERRKKAEESLAHLKNEWRRMASCFSQVGLSFPPFPNGQDTDDEDPVSEVCQEVVITRLVSEAFQRDLARAEAEAFAELAIESKNHEISRLCDRLQYSEAVNREMSQRNQEEKARQRHQKRRSRQKLLWGCFGLSITIGASLFVHSYLSSPGAGIKGSEVVDNSFEPCPTVTKSTTS